MKTKVFTVLLLPVCLILVSTLTFAHHSNSMYEEEYFVSLTGIVARYEVATR